MLAVAREGKSVTETGPEEIAGQFLQGNFDPALTKFKVGKNGTQFSVEAETKAGIAFGKLFGYEDLPITAAATADIAYASYEIALVLDTTGSMKGGKLSSMKDAVLGLLDTMPAQVNDEDKLKFAVVPFASFVNVGPGFGPSFDKKGKQIAGTGAAWLDLKGSHVPQTELVPGPAAFSSTTISARRGPGAWKRAGRPTRTTTSTTRRGPAKPDTLFVPAFAHRRAGHRRFRQQLHQFRCRAQGQEPREKKKMGQIWRRDRRAGNPLLGGLLDCWSLGARQQSGPGNTNGKKIPSTPAPRSVASKGAGTWLRDAAHHPADQRL